MSSFYEVKFDNVEEKPIVYKDNQKFINWIDISYRCASGKNTATLLAERSNPSKGRSSDSSDA